MLKKVAVFFGIFSLIFLAFSKNSQAKCFEDIRLLTGTQAESLEFVFGKPHADEARDFLLHAAFDGSVPIPANMDLQFGLANFRSGSVAAQSKKVRYLLRDLRKPDALSERAILIVEYVNGTSRAVFQGSAPSTKLSLEDFYMSLAAAGMLEKGGPLVRRIRYIHTHVEEVFGEGTACYPRYAEFGILQKLRDGILFDWESGPRPVEGFVLPACENCDDLFIQYLPDGMQGTVR